MTTAIKPVSVIDGAALRRDLEQLAEKANTGDIGQIIRPDIVARLKLAIQEGQKEAEAILMKNGKGKACAKRLSHLTDVIIQTLYQFVVERIYPSQNPSSGERIALVAVGGYGRGTQAPGSDIDIHFLLPWKQTPWGEQVMEYILYMLWDVGMKVGHATRNVDESIRMAKEDMTVRTALLEALF